MTEIGLKILYAVFILYILYSYSRLFYKLRQLGPVRVKLDANRLNADSMVGILILFFVLYFVLSNRLYWGGIRTSGPYLFVLPVIFLINSVTLLYKGLYRPDIREGGISSGFQVWRWEEIGEYSWEGEYLTIGVRSRMFPGRRTVRYPHRVEPSRREEVNSLLHRYLPGKACIKVVPGKKKD